MKIIFCEDPLMRGQPDSIFGPEAEAASALGIDFALIDFEALTQQSDAAKAVRKIQPHDATQAIYRGWMLKSEQYATLYDALLDRGVRLINDPEAYRHCHHLPESYPVIAGHTPETVWLECSADVSIDQVMALLEPFGGAAVIVKDYVKSQKHHWDEACFIPDASDRAQVERVTRRFIELQDGDLSGGLVFRRYVDFDRLATHSLSGMPLSREYRIFYLRGQPFYSIEYWEEGSYQEAEAPIRQFSEIAQNIRSQLFTLDIAQFPDGGWLIVEPGDAQVAGLPERADATRFYENLRAAW